MDEILQKLLSSELLSEEAKAEISTTWATLIEQQKTAVREEVTMQVRAEIAEQWATERDDLVASVQEFVDSKLSEEVTEFRSDIERFRDLEAESAEKIVEEKHRLASTLAEELDELVNKMDAFFELRLTEEFEELREDLDVVKQNQFGKKIFEAFATEFNRSYVDEDSIQAKLASTKAKLQDAEKNISRLEEAQAKMIREAKLESILSPLSGRKKEQMTFILANVETARLEEAYNQFIGRLIKDENPTNVTDKTLVESAVVTGNESLVETQTQTVDNAEKYSHLRKLAGIA